MLSAKEICFKYRERSQKRRNVTPMTLDVEHYWSQTYWQSGRKKWYVFRMRKVLLRFIMSFAFRNIALGFLKLIVSFLTIFRIWSSLDKTEATDGPLMVAARSFCRQRCKTGGVLKRPYPFLQDWPEKKNYVAEKKRKIEPKVLTTDHSTDAKKINTVDLQNGKRKRKRPCAEDFFDDKPAKVKPEEVSTPTVAVSKHVWNMVRLCRYEADLNKGEFFQTLSI